MKDKITIYNVSDFIETEYSFQQLLEKSREERLAREKEEARKKKINMLLGE